MKKNENKDMFKAAWNYAAAPESTDHINLQKQYDLYIDGKFIKPVKGKYFDTINPSNDKKIASVAEATAEDVDLAVKAARKPLRAGQICSVKTAGNIFLGSRV